MFQLLLNRLREIIDALVSKRVAKYKKTLPTCDMYGCNSQAVRSKKYCRPHMLYCEYCGKDEVALQTNGHQVCSDCLIAGHTKYEPTYNGFTGKRI